MPAGTGLVGGVRSGWAGGPVGGDANPPDESLAGDTIAPIIDRMQIIGAAPPPKPHFPSLVIGAATGTVLVVSGLTIWFATLVTPYVDTIAEGRFGGPSALGGVFLRWLAVALGAVFLGVGAARTFGGLYARAAYRIERGPEPFPEMAHEIGVDAAVLLRRGSSLTTRLTHATAGATTATHVQLRVTWGF